ncbi:hypothetical protein G6038_29335 [Rhodococcus sp. 14C212]|nr:hypothetical protein [Rhodococcus sp. 14C212]NGP09496.1 hypothetical protein [Rhodococcus sp. 14C212]
MDADTYALAATVHEGDKSLSCGSVQDSVIRRSQAVATESVRLGGADDRP